MTEEKKNKSGWFSKIQSRDDAIKIAKDCGMGFFVVAAIQAAIGVWILPSLIFDAAVFAICGFFIQKSFSRTAAVIALLLSVAAVITTLMNKVGASVGGGNNIILALIVFWAAVRSVESTFKLHGRYKNVATVKEESATPT